MEELCVATFLRYELESNKFQRWTSHGFRATRWRALTVIELKSVRPFFIARVDCISCAFSRLIHEGVEKIHKLCCHSIAQPFAAARHPRRNLHIVIETCKLLQRLIFNDSSQPSRKTFGVKWAWGNKRNALDETENIFREKLQWKFMAWHERREVRASERKTFPDCIWPTFSPKIQNRKCEQRAFSTCCIPFRRECLIKWFIDFSTAHVFWKDSIMSRARDFALSVQKNWFDYNRVFRSKLPDNFKMHLSLHGELKLNWN